MTSARKRRDWMTPVLLTLSLHLLAFTLFVNHRLFSLLAEPKVGSQTLQISALTGDDPEQTETGEDEGAAATGPAEPAPAASVADLVRPSEELPPMPLPAKSSTTESAVKPEPVRPDAMGGMTLAERLAMLRPAGGSSGGHSGFVAGGGSHSLRGQGRRGEGLRRNGGSSETEDAVELGLAWLASVQDIDGRWDSDGYMSHYLHGADQYERAAEGIGMMRNDIGVSALCLMAFAGAGYEPEEGRYAATVRRARDWLLSQQRAEDGGFGLERESARPDMYGHVLACLGLCDLYLQTGDEKLRSPLQRAFNYLLEMQGPGGGWDYAQRWPARAVAFKQTTRNDLSISGWAIMALCAAREAGFGVPQENLKRIAGFLKEATLADGDAIYANEGTRSGARGLAMLAVSNVSRRLLGEPATGAIQERQRRRIAANPPSWADAGDFMGSNEYAWYYGTLAMLLGRDAEGGDNRWREWNGAMKKTLLANQCRAGPRKGSFDPVGYWAANGGGRLYMTALCVLNLEVYYRYEPEYLRVRSAELAGLWE